MRRLLISLAAGTLLVIGTPAASALAAEPVSAIPTAAVIDSGGTGTLRNVASGGCLEQKLETSLGIPTPQVADCTDVPNQEWIFKVAANGALQLTNQVTKACLDQDFTGGVQHPRVIIFPCVGGDNQLWKPIKSGKSFMLKNMATGGCLDQNYSNSTPHPDVLVYSCHGDRNQLWR